ncbi:hypothetical protein ACRJ4B_51890 [Streptomyces sp. GTA36]
MWRRVVLAFDGGSNVFVILNDAPHDAACTRAATSLSILDSASRGLEVSDVVAIEQQHPAPEKATTEAPALLLAAYLEAMLRGLGIDDKILWSARSTDDPQLEAFGALLTEHVRVPRRA